MEIKYDIADSFNVESELKSCYAVCEINCAMFSPY